MIACRQVSETPRSAFRVVLVRIYFSGI